MKRGVLKIVDVAQPYEHPQTPALHQNYPKPFNPATRIPFVVRRSGFVSLKVYDLLGRAVATLVNAVKQSGEYRVEWNAEGMPSGVYFYQLRTDDFVETKKLALLR
jgi:hypothetical protein